MDRIELSRVIDEAFDLASAVEDTCSTGVNHSQWTILLEGTVSSRTFDSGIRRRRITKLVIATTLFLAAGARPAAAQEPTTITGQVTGADGSALASASIFIESMSLSTLTNQDGRYMLIIPASRVQGQQVAITISLLGYRTTTATIALRSGTITQDFQLNVDPLRLDEIVVIGAGLSQERQKLGVTINSVRAEDIRQSQEPNLVAALAAKAPNVRVTSSAGDPGAGAYIMIRGATSLLGDGQPLFVVDGIPIDNSSRRLEGHEAGTVDTNRAVDINPNDIESIEILKGAAASAIYGSSAADGVVLITTKSGRSGTNNVTYRFSYSRDQVNKMLPLQRSFGQGMAANADAVADLATYGINVSPGDDVCIYYYGLPKERCPVSWGARLDASTPTYDHAWELFRPGSLAEHHLTWSGGSDRTTYYLSMGRMDHAGTIKGNQAYDRTTLRLKGSHAFRDDLRIGGNFSYASSSGDLVQQGSNISGILLGALRTPPDFNNWPYMVDVGGVMQHRSYRLQNPVSISQGRGYDNPFWVSHEITNTTKVGRTIGNVTLDYTPLPWLSVNYNLGADYGVDERATVIPQSSSDFPQGRMIRGDFVTSKISHNLLVSGNHTFNENIAGRLSVGQNLDQEDFRQYQVNGANLIGGTDQLDFTITRTPDEFRSRVRTDGYFTNGGLGLYNQLFLTAGIRVDGSSTFGGKGKRFTYPNVGAAWEFTRALGESNLLSFGKLRYAFGIAGKKPPVFSNISAFETTTLTDGWLSPNGLQTIYRGRDGVISEFTLGNSSIKPERTAEHEVGGDLAFFDNRLALGLTYYRQHTTDAILAVGVAPSTGYQNRYANAGEFENRGWEATAELRAIERPNFHWTVGAQWGRNRSCVKSLAGSEQFGLAGFTGAVVSVVAAEWDASGKITHCYPFGVIHGDDFVRFGRGIEVDGVMIDQAYAGQWKKGDLYIDDDGFPIMDGQSRVIGDPNPDWTASLRSSITLYRNVRLSGLLDIKRGGDVWNGTKGATYFFGTSKELEAYQGEGKKEIFGQTYYKQWGVAGPGAGEEVTLNWLTWFFDGIGSSFTGPSVQSIEDGGYVKLREISLAYTVQAEQLRRLGFNSMELMVSGRNLKTWTKYTGIDPEANLWGQSLGRGVDYFNNPQTRSWVINVTLNR
jgi:TonB-linked SusC/RagA family outer membrane protein